MFILMRGELLQLDVDRETTIAKIPEGSVFGETVVLRNLEVGGLVWVGGWLGGREGRGMGGCVGGWVGAWVDGGVGRWVGGWVGR